MVDITRSLTSEDLIRRYGLEDLKTDRKTINETKQTVSRKYNIIKKYVQLVAKDQDKQTSWFSTGLPTENKTNGDYYYDQGSGKVYEYQNGWIEVDNLTLAESMAIANSEADAQDGKRITFFTTPTTPYSSGDVWLDNNTIMRCRCSRESGNYSSTDWVTQSEYSDDSVTKDVRTVVDKLLVKVENEYVTTTQLETKDGEIRAYVGEQTVETKQYADGQISKNNTDYVDAKIDVTAGEINEEVGKKMNNGDFTKANIILKINDNTSSAKINADIINLSANDVLNLLAGNTINLSSKNIAINSTNFSVTKDGVLTAKSGTIGGWNLEPNNLYTGTWGTDNSAMLCTGSQSSKSIGGSGNINGWVLTAGSKFGVTKNGNLYASNANISGTITSNNATITGGKFEIISDKSVAVIKLIDILADTRYTEMSSGGFKITNNSGIFEIGYDSTPFLKMTFTNKEAIIGYDKLKIENIECNNIKIGRVDTSAIQSGTCTLTSAGDTTVYFDKTFNGVPNVVLTPYTTTNGVIAAKISEITTTYFKANIGGTSFGNNRFCYVAIYSGSDEF